MNPHATLFHPFLVGDLPPLDAEARALLLNAQPGLDTPEGFEADLRCVQGFRPFFLPLLKAGWQVAPQESGEDYDAVLVQCGRHRGQNEAWLAEAVSRVKPGNLVVVAGDSTSGVTALRKRLEKNEDRLAEAIARRRSRGVALSAGGGLFEPRLYDPIRSSIVVDIEGHLSKNHGSAFWLRRSPDAEAFVSMVRKLREDGPPVEGGFIAAPGMFSHNRVDPGSEFLAGCLPADLRGTVADFGAGWGYLAVEVAKRCPAVSGIDLYEADFSSLEAAKANLAAHAGVRKAGFFWHDLLAEPVEPRYDAIVMNPPFHQGREAQPSLGQGFIAAAAKALKKGGRLLLVANRGLPYEAALEAAFASVEEIARDKRFKVLGARR